jgi:predicted phage terminase large subunit-like protein
MAADWNAAERQTIEAAYQLFGPARLRNCPATPTARQEAFLLLEQFEVFFGGAAGGGKTAALLMAALQYSDVPGYHALLVRTSLAELYLPGNLIDLSHQWLAGSKARWNGDQHQWRFPGPGPAGAGGASVGFGYLADQNDVARYAGASYSFLGFDELTRFGELLYRRMLRVLRQPTGLHHGATARDGTRLSEVPLRVRSASNPGGPNHEWVRARFVDPSSRAQDAIFLPSRLADNPHLDQDSYTQTLTHLPPAERERLLNGDWEIADDGELFRREWFPLIEPAELPPHTIAVRYWDLAGTAASSANRDPDWTVGLRLELHRQTGVFYITSIVRDRQAPGTIEQLVLATAHKDGRAVTVVIEQEPGGSGKAIIDRYKRHVLRGYICRSDRPTGPKDIRARPVAAAAENGLLRLVRGPNTNPFLDELTAFPNARHDDCVDALSGAHTDLATRSHRPARVFDASQIAINPLGQAGAHTHFLSDEQHFEQLAHQLGVPLWRPGE